MTKQHDARPVCRDCGAYEANGLWFMPGGGQQGVDEECRRYQIKCDDCKATIGTTDLLSESAAGGRCEECRAAPASYPEAWKSA